MDRISKQLLSDFVESQEIPKKYVGHPSFDYPL